MQALFAATYADEIAAVLRDGGIALVREKLAVLSDGERRALRTALEAACVDHRLTTSREGACLRAFRPESQRCELVLIKSIRC